MVIEETREGIRVSEGPWLELSLRAGFLYAYGTFFSAGFLPGIGPSPALSAP